MQEKDLLTALSPGVPLWFLPPLEASRWAKRIDWYLGFQIRRAEPHAAAGFSSELHSLVEDLEVDLPVLRLSQTAPLMIASENFLPNRQTIVVPFSGAGGLQEWVAHCFKIWQGLGRPAARIFLPEQIAAEAFTAKWPSSKGHESSEGALELVSDSIAAP